MRSAAHAATLAQADGTSARINIWDNAILDEWRIPFGDWIEQAIDWVAVNLPTLLDVIRWPFDTMIRNLVRDFLVEISWVWIVVAMALLAWITRNAKVAAFVAVALTICGLLGDGYWKETAATIGFIGVAVILCVAIGIPVGIACGRVDSIWQVTRPILDAMQVVHSFVYMLPFIWFFDLGEVSATMVTMVFALPPLIRLTNLGIRQVPADVVEASRAYGASELRVLFDVQIPLARPAIMTGINQTLLLAISMLGIAAIMGAAGLGRLLFRAINNQNAALAASAGLAFFLVAVVLDRMSQREGTESTHLLKRIYLAWKHRRDPEVLIPDAEESAVVKHDEVEVFAPIGSRERLAMAVSLIGATAAVLSTLLPWSIDAGKMSAFGRWADASLEGQLAGQAFSGLDSTGGSWFGITVLALGAFVIIAVIGAWTRPGRAPRWLAADGAAIAGICLLIVAWAHFWGQSVSEARVAPDAVDPAHGVGMYLAVIGGLIAVIGTLLWIRVAEHTPLHPLPTRIGWGSLIGLGIAVLVVVLGMFSAWTADSRPDRALTPEALAEAEARAERIEELKRLSEEDPANNAVYAADLLVETAIARKPSTTDGITRDGSQLGLWALVAGVLAVLTGLPAAGIFGSNEQRRWRWSTVTAGLGLGVASIAFAWIFTHVRSGDPQFLTGIGAFLTMLGGLMVLASTMVILKEFRRAKVYGDPLDSNPEAAAAAPDTVKAPV